jgi:Icc-related predicted phosphoesterase
MTEYLIVGDVHGDISFASKMTKLAKSHGIETIIQVGDFGIWDHSPDGVYFLDQLNENSAESRHGSEVRWVFVPGNHENYDSLEEYQYDPYRTDEGFTVIRDRIHYAGKVNKWAWDGVIFKAVGGAHSIDKAYRKPGRSWWWQETLTDAELAKSAELGETDVLLTHDCPTYAPFRHRLKNDPDSHIHRQKIDEVVKHSQATVHFHGHMHDWYDYASPWGGKIYGLECNDDAMYATYAMGRPPTHYKNHVILNIIEDGNGIWYDVNERPYFKTD